MRLASKKKSDARQLADVAVEFPGILTGLPDYDLFVGLWLNLPRVRNQRAATFAHGMALNRYQGPLPWDFYDAMEAGENPAAIGVAQAEDELARMTAAAVRKYSR